MSGGGLCPVLQFSDVNTHNTNKETIRKLLLSWSSRKKGHTTTRVTGKQQAGIENYSIIDSLALRQLFVRSNICHDFGPKWPLKSSYLTAARVVSGTTTVWCLDQQLGVWPHLLFEQPPYQLPELGLYVFEGVTVGDP